MFFSGNNSSGKFRTCICGLRYDILLTLILLCCDSTSGIRTSIKERETTKLGCRNPKERIDIKHLSYDLIRDELRFRRSSFCSTSSIMDSVKDKCHGYRECTLQIRHPRRCPRKVMIYVDYDCVPCKPRRSRRMRSTGGLRFYCDLTARLPLKPSRQNHLLCPNARFVSKHVSTGNPNTVTGAAVFVNEVYTIRNIGNTPMGNTQSIFIAANMNYYLDPTDQNICVFGRRAPKYNCIRAPGAALGWNCAYQGNIIARHNINTGHYLHNRDQ